MRRFLLIFLLALPAFAQTRYTTNTTPAVVLILLNDGTTIPIGTGQLTSDGTNYSWSAAGGGSQTPLASDIDVAGFGFVNSNGAVRLLSMTNGEASFVGYTSGVFPFEAGYGSQLSLTSAVSHATIWSGYVSGPRGTLDFVPEADAHPDVGLRIATHSVYGTDDCFFQAIPTMTGYGALEGVGGLGFILGTSEGNGPLIFSINRIEGARLAYDGDTDQRHFLIGSSSEDDSGALLQVAGDVHLTGKLTSDGGIDPPWMLYDTNTRAAVKDDADANIPKEKQTGFVQFKNEATHQFEIYAPSENKFYAMDGKTVLRSPAATELTAAASKRLTKLASMKAKQPKPITGKTNSLPINKAKATK